MYQSSELEVWNLAPGIKTITGAQQIFNIVGSLKSPEKVKRFTYSLNDCKEKQIFFNSTESQLGRLQNRGDFNIDTINTSDLHSENHLILRIIDHENNIKEYIIDFPCFVNDSTVPDFRLDFEGVSHPQEVGQVVDGKWQLSRDELGKRCLEIKKEDAGYDRIIVFGHHDWTSAYEITARMCVTGWSHPYHNVGLVFKWNHHLQGDGTYLPAHWSTGLGYYYSHSPGLRIRFGTDVHIDNRGKKVGDYLLGESPYSHLRRWVGEKRKKFLPKKDIFSQLVPGKLYCFRMLVHPAKYALTVWEQNKREPIPQIIVSEPIERLPMGATGIIAYHCGVRVYEFNVSQEDLV